MTMMTIEEVENDIYTHYQWFAKNAPGVVVREEGRLAQLWAAFDRLVRYEEEG